MRKAIIINCDKDVRKIKKRYKEDFYLKCRATIPSVRGNKLVDEEYPQSEVGTRYYMDITKCDLDNGFTWSKSYIPLREADDLEEFKTITTYHDYGGYYGLFKPDLKEVYSQIAESVDDIEEISAFSIQNITAKYDSEKDLHVVETILYKKK